jgi:hypothetical protein
MTINIMSLAGVILALGDMVDSGVVLVENAHKKIEEAEREGRRAAVDAPSSSSLGARAGPFDVRRAAGAHHRVLAGVRAAG